MIEDNTYQQARKLVVEKQTASTQMLCREIEVPYNEAAEIMQRLEVDGVVGEFTGNTPRVVKVKS